LPFEESPKDPYLNTKDKEKQRKVLIKVDLTIESFYSAEDSNSMNHLGIMATNSMKEWMAAYPSLHTVSIVLKDLLKRRELNNIYKGTKWANFRRHQLVRADYCGDRLHARQAPQ